MKPEVQRALKRAVDALSPLPVLEGTVLEVRRLAGDPDASTAAVVAVIERDEAFAANLLRLANCAAAARASRASTIRQAVTLVGRRAIGRLALEAATYRFLERAPGTGSASRGQMHVHAMTVATIATAAAQRADASVDTVHLAALLHDVGKLVLPAAFGEHELEQLAREAPTGCRRAELEREQLGVDHAQAGALLARRSNLPGEVVDAIHYHHGAHSGQQTPTPEAACVQLANAVAGLLTGALPDDELLHAALVHLELPVTALDELAQVTLPPNSPAAEASLAARVKELEHLAATDELTSLSNRRHWLSHVQRRLAAAEPGGLLLCDVDRFKTINDTHGHHAGDHVLIDIARVLDRHGFAGRLGGDEFAIWIPGSPTAARTAAHAILTDTHHQVSCPGASPGTVALSIGAALAPHDGHDVTTLLEKADAALYHAKTNGRGRAHLASP